MWKETVLVYLDICLQEQSKTGKSVRIAGLRAEIKLRGLLNVKQPELVIRNIEVLPFHLPLSLLSDRSQKDFPPKLYLYFLSPSSKIKCPVLCKDLHLITLKQNCKKYSTRSREVTFCVMGQLDLTKERPTLPPEWVLPKALDILLGELYEPRTSKLLMFSVLHLFVSSEYCNENQFKFKNHCPLPVSETSCMLNLGEVYINLDLYMLF
jgi:hypothetical protein